MGRGAQRAAGRAMPGKWQGALLLLQHCLPTAPRFPPRKRGRARRGGPADNFRPACRARHRACLGAVDAIAASRVARRHKPLAKRRPIFPAKLLPRERKLSKQTTRTGAQADDTKVWRRKAGSARPLEALSAVEAEAAALRGARAAAPLHFRWTPTTTTTTTPRTAFVAPRHASHGSRTTSAAPP